MDHLKQRGGLTRFIHLEVANEMEANLRKIREQGLLGRELLHVVLPEVAQAGQISLFYRTGREFLRNGHYLNVRSCATRSCDGPRDAGLEDFESLGEVRDYKWQITILSAALGLVLPNPLRTCSKR